ncbi:hypothetical protein LTT02_22260 [Mycolicibacterium smegmatis]|uniref:hypothetical protein n=1 Tax=Mycolicibacterium smegmatis TaxID=1772 RepID=UPI0012FFA26B|nr:hypothetical protein [Mycolicibacterium smegmatis]MDF1899788.1 hypothetical protein [Mycolicibacterium smegmatis]MDF1905576.1 hypothetical protein [Mycolicibacterium smegmatis]MDF1917825.1 hypothetical protein [Mycolicibacterium smegmatis]MDF1924619.1 hypothetical protein [Mycolicibacterium smegmatis]UAK57654.1 hypothetical protein K8P01_13530 [Mycolicibacterium smegmatis]
MTINVYCDHEGRSPRFTFPKVTEDGEASPEITRWRLDGRSVAADTPGARRSYTLACPVCQSNYRFGEDKLIPALIRLREVGQREISIQNLQHALSRYT